MTIEEDTAPADEAAPKGHHFSDFHGRMVLVKNVSVGQRMVAQGIVRGLEANALTDADVPRIMDKILTLIEALVPLTADRDHIETLLLRATIDFEHLAALILAAPPQAPKTGPVKQPKRGK